MSAFKSMLKVALSLIFLLAGCKGGHAGISGGNIVVEVYYRDFDKLWPIDYTEEDLVKSPVIRRVYTKARDADELGRLLEGDECEADFVGDLGDIDVYLLVKEFSAGKLSRKWIGSKFDMVALPDGRVCKMTMEQRTAIDSFLRREQ